MHPYQHVIVHRSRRRTSTPLSFLVGFWVIAILTAWTVLYQHHQASRRACVHDLTVAWSADPRNVDRTLPDYRWFERQCE